MEETKQNQAETGEAIQDEAKQAETTQPTDAPDQPDAAELPYSVSVTGFEAEPNEMGDRKATEEFKNFFPTKCKGFGLILDEGDGVRIVMHNIGARQLLSALRHPAFKQALLLQKLLADLDDTLKDD